MYRVYCKNFNENCVSVYTEECVQSLAKPPKILTDDYHYFRKKTVCTALLYGQQQHD